VPLLGETGRQVDEIVAGTQARGRVPSLVAAVVRDGVLAHFTGAGNLPEPDPDMQYRIGSISKTLTAALVLQLRDEGRLALDDQLDRHLPGTPVGALTLRQLLGHVSGLQREPAGDWWERAPGSDLDTLLAGLTPDKLAYPPYRTFHYSNLAYGLLGAALHRLTGESWATLVTERLLEPLEMTRTTYHPTEPFARGHVVHPWHGTLREEPRHDAGTSRTSACTGRRVPAWSSSPTRTACATPRSTASAWRSSARCSTGSRAARPARGGPAPPRPPTSRRCAAAGGGWAGSTRWFGTASGASW
jgi:CubicO group peptidase (beta-lactamase class C family)